MKLKTIKDAVTSKMGRQILIGQKHSPEVMFVAGVIGVVATVVVASRATLKLTDVLDEAEKDTITAHTLVSVKYSEEDRKKDLMLIKLRTIGKVAKLYLPAVGLGALSIGLLTGSHVVLSRRNMGLTAAYAALDKGFREYRGRVVAEYGDDKDQEFRFGQLTREVVEETDQGPVVKTVSTLLPGEMSIYAKFFDEGSPNWQKEAEYNRIFLQCQQNFANDMLNARGHLFLNEVYDMLGLDRSKAGAVVGWVKGKGDPFVDFGIFSGRERAKAFVNGWEPTILLDFNVAGNILDLI